jgi:hypothetical protein
MSRAVAFLAVLAAVVVGAWYYLKSTQSVAPAGTNNIRATVDTVAIKNDLLGIAQAERVHMASQGKYASIDDLVAAGELPAAHASRPNWNYVVNLSDTGFKIFAIYSGPPQGDTPPRFSIDETMQVSSQ